MPDKNELNKTSIIEIENVKLKECLLIIGFCGPGLVGQIAVNHIIEALGVKKIGETLGLKNIGYLKFNNIYPVTIMNEGGLKYPFRVYSNEMGKLCLIIGEVPLDLKNINHLTSCLFDWIENKNVKEVIVLDGIPINNLSKSRKSRNVKFCSTESKKIAEFEKSCLKISSIDIIKGITAAILYECLIRKKTGVALLAPTMALKPDPDGAAMLINAINNFYNLKIDMGSLLKNPKQVKEKYKVFISLLQIMEEKRMKKGFRRIN